MKPSTQKNDPPSAIWDFSKSKLPDEQCEAAYLWEYSLGLGPEDSVRTAILEESEAVKRQQKIRETRAFLRWLKCHPEPSWEDLERVVDWNAEAERSFPELRHESKLMGRNSGAVRWLIENPFFPDRHWLDLEQTVRMKLSEAHSRLFMMSRRANLKLTEVQGTFGITRRGIHWLYPLSPLDSELGLLRQELFGNPMGFEGQGSNGISTDNRWEAWQVFGFNWARSNRQILSDFKSWLEENRPEDRPHFAVSRQTSFREKLRCLGALRVLIWFGLNTSKAINFTARRSREHKPLYSEPSDWRKVQAKAKIRLAHFTREVLG